jgi:hypothetical protein
MPGAVLQLAAYGAQDIFLTGNPEITYFKIIYKRHTNFASESILVPQNYNVQMGSTYTFDIPRQGDLLSSIFLHIQLDKPNIVQSYLGYNLIDSIEFKISNQTIDKQYGEWMALWCDMTHTYDKGQMLDDMLSNSANTLIVPLQFWFCRNPALTIPLIAIQYHPIQIIIKLRKSTEIIGNPEITDFKIYADYIFLDTDERRRYTQNAHEYLIEQVQRTESQVISSTASRSIIDFQFSHPVKELVWIIYDVSGTIYNTTHCEQADKVLIQMNSQDRLSERSGLYFTRQQRYQHHTGAGSFSSFPYIHIYSFAFRPEEHQPSGSCNFSRIDNATLGLTFDNSTKISGTEYRVVRIYAVNYNVLRILNGLGGLAYTS